MNDALVNLASKKFGIMTIVLYALWDVAVKQPDKAWAMMIMFYFAAGVYMVYQYKLDKMRIEKGIVNDEVAK